MNYFSSVIFNIVLGLLTTVLLLYLYFKWLYTFWNRKGVTAPPCSFPFGNLKDVALGTVSFQEVFKQMYKELKPKGLKFGGFYFFYKPVLVALDIELIKSILIKDFSYFTDHGLFDKRDYDRFSGHLFALKGAEWKIMREKLSPLFTVGKLKIMFPTIESCSTQLVKLIDFTAENSKQLNIQDVAGRYTTDIIASVAFGIETNSLKNPHSDFRKYGELATGNAGASSALRLLLQIILPDISTYLKLPAFPKDVNKFFLEIVQSTIKYREENNILRKDFMQLMIQLKNNINISDKTDDDDFNLLINGKNNKNATESQDLCSLSIEDVAAQTLIFFIAGYDTSSITIALCMYELAFQQDIQEKLRDEINTVLHKYEGTLSYNAVMEMTYMDNCIKETLRKYPLFSTLFRECTKPYKVPDSDLIIPKGMIIMIPAQELHYDPEYYPEPEKFDPERFSCENISSKTWLPFGEGPRICIGARLGIVQIKVALTKLLGNFRYTLDSRTVYPMKKAPRSFVVTSQEHILLNVEKITN